MILSFLPPSPFLSEINKYTFIKKNRQEQKEIQSLISLKSQVILELGLIFLKDPGAYRG